jgi:putative SOS response-associated peptidase YedK
MINARAETLAEKPAFKNALKRRRCLVPVNGFFEWKREGKHKTPYFIRPAQGELISFAGLWEEWKDAEGRPVRSFTIITCEPNGLMAPIHDRMPAVIAPAQRAAWLDPNTSVEDALKLLKPCPGEWLQAGPVSNLVNSAANNFPEVIEPV